MKAMILAAGFGTRLKPISDRIPKPLLPFLNKPILVHCISFLKKHGITDIIINVHHLPDMIMEQLGNGEAYGVNLSYSKEESILGTGGGIKRASEFLADSDPFVVMNSDFIVDFDLTSAIDFHISENAIATMILREDQQMKQYGTIGINKKGHIEKFTTLFGKDSDLLRKGHFTGIHIFSKSVLSYLEKMEKDFFCINKDIYAKFFKNQESVCGFFMSGKWLDLGTLDDYFRVQMENLEDAKHIDPSCVVANEVTLNAPVLIGKGSSVGKGSVLGPHAIVGNNCVIGENVCLHDAIVFDEMAIPNDQMIRDQIIYQNG